MGIRRVVMPGPHRNDEDRNAEAAAAGAGVLTLLRHGQSAWNREGRFSGWADVDLSPQGRAEAERAGRLLARSGRPVDCCFTSMLKRAQATAGIVLGEMGQHDLPLQQNWRLNERHYGALQGLGLWPAVQRFGPLKVIRCRRGFDVRPPALPPGDPRSAAHDPRYASVAAEGLPAAESVADTLVRLLPYWQERIVPELARGRHVLVVSHKHTLRALLRLMRQLAPGQLPHFRIATGMPMVMRFEPHDDWVLDRWARGGTARDLARCAG